MLTVLAAGSVLFCGCGGDGESPAEGSMVMEEIGRIDEGDATDPDHAGLPYDSYLFQADLMDSVTLQIRSEGFTPMTKLVEVETGAVLAEWDSQYAESDGLTYTIASTGSYEARVYATDGGVGDYKLTITVFD
jgi:hypothetical protein